LSRDRVPIGVISVMPQAWSIWAPNFLSKSSIRLRGAAEPPIGMQRIEEMSWLSFSQSSFTPIHTVGTAPTVTRSRPVISTMSRGRGEGPPKIWVAPTMTPAKGTHQALAWNIGTMWRMTSRSERARESAWAMPSEWR
jgi:hypothetical protein